MFNSKILELEIFVRFYFVLFNFQRIHKKARQMAQQVKIFVVKPEDLKTYTME